MSDNPYLSARHAEQSLIGALLIDEGLIPGVSLKIKPDDFESDVCRSTYAAMLHLADEGRPIDYITVLEAISKLREREDAEHHLPERPTVEVPIDWMMGLTELVPISSNAPAYASQVKVAALRRQLIEGMRAVALEAKSGRDIGVCMGHLADLATRFGMQARIRQPLPMRAVARLIADDVEAALQGENVLEAIPTGFPTLDACCPFLPGDLVVLAARASVGKTALGVGVAEFVGRQELAKGDDAGSILVVSAEMEAKRIGHRFYSVSSGQNMRRQLLRIAEDSISEQELDRIVTDAGKLAQLPVWVLDTPNIELHELIANVRYMAANERLRMVVVDYLQLIKIAKSKANTPRYVEVGEISKALKALARELRIVVVALAQLNRESDKNPDALPRLSQLRESGDIEQDADTAILIHRKSKRDPAGHFVIAKSRDGIADHVFPITFDGLTQRFAEAANNPDIEPEVEQAFSEYHLRLP